MELREALQYKKAPLKTPPRHSPLQLSPRLRHLPPRGVPFSGSRRIRYEPKDGARAPTDALRPRAAAPAQRLFAAGVGPREGKLQVQSNGGEYENKSRQRNDFSWS